MWDWWWWRLPRLGRCSEGALQGLIAGKPAPTFESVRKSSVGAGLPAMGPVPIAQSRWMVTVPAGPEGPA
ncbi:hypothetical protein GDV60_07130 [Pseudomonas sp. DTU12.1]|nr:hypothetical protein GDV60_07130 [Pseudomonas sp. DTU12.1]